MTCIVGFCLVGMRFLHDPETTFHELHVPTRGTVDGVNGQLQISSGIIDYVGNKGHRTSPSSPKKAAAGRYGYYTSPYINIHTYTRLYSICIVWKVMMCMYYGVICIRVL